jgi:hypothetical protein
MKHLKWLVLLQTILCVNHADAFDGNRQGFLLSLGGGFHNTGTDFLYDGDKFADDSFKGLATSFKIGAGITNQLTAYFVRNASWFSEYNSFLDDDVTNIIGLAGVGATYYLAPSSPSGFAMGAIGVADWSAPFESDLETDTGAALMLGLGYEFSPHTQIELTLLSTSIESSEDRYLTAENTSIQVTFNYLFY